jgi:xanthine dehydrogenase YagR molybdenum-binding subunit
MIAQQDQTEQRKASDTGQGNIVQKKVDGTVQLEEKQPSEPKLPPAVQLKERYTGVAKVTGTAKFAAEFREPFPAKDMVYAFLVQSTIPNGTIASMDAKQAERAPGVIAVLTPFNAPKLPAIKPEPPARRHLSVLQDKLVHYNGQPIAVVVAKSLDEAKQGARMLKIEYEQQPALLNFMERLGEARPPKQSGKTPQEKHRGDVKSEMGKASVIVEETYITPIQNHNPMEPHATIAWWEGEKLNVYDSTQYISGDRMALATILNLPVDYVRVQCPYTGGGFGCKGSMWSHVPLAALCSKVVQKPVQLVLERSQMFGPVGARPTTVNKITLAAVASGKLLVMKHDETMHTSVMEDFVEPAVDVTRSLYASASNSTLEQMVDMNLGVGTFMRAPGESSGTAVLEIAMDEMAEKLAMDPVQFRMVNYAERDMSEDKPWSSKHLDECYKQAAEKFGWAKVAVDGAYPQPGQKMEGNERIGYGMATATYPANRSAAMATVKILPNGRGYVGSGTQDLGTGTYTIMAQTAGRFLGLDPKLIEVKLGDSTLPKAPVSGGSQSAASVCPAVEDAAKQAVLKLTTLAVGDAQSPLHGAMSTDVDVKDGRIFLKSDESKGETFKELLQRNGGNTIEAQGSAQPGEDRTSMTSHSWGAVFAEVAVDKDTHMVKVRRVVATYDIGTLMNDTTGINQLVGGIVWAVGFALEEEAHIDNTYGRTVNENLAEYHVPVNPDIGDIDVTVLNIPDTKFSPLGARGIGEIGITGAAAAVANAIYNATGKRVRHYPITPDKIMLA